MKRLALCLALLMVNVPSLAAADSVAAPAASSRRASKLMHVVSFKFKPEATKQQIDEVVAAFRALKTKIPTIQELSSGTNVSPEKLNKGFTHAFVLSFGSDKDRDAYLVHPDHVAFGKLLGPILADVFVIDYWAQ
jgi:hypothetical protein